MDDGTFTGAPPPPVNPGAGLTIAQADARYAQTAGVLNFAPGVTGTTGGAGDIWTACPRRRCPATTRW